jgi:phosphate/phosphite/phosphonate ABC transporter binding protein
MFKERKLLSLFLVVLALVLVLGVYWHKSSPRSSKLSHPPHEIGREKINICIGGSGSVFPLIQILIDEFKRRHPEYKITVPPSTHTRGGIMGVTTGEYDIGLMSRNPSSEEEKREFFQVPFARDAMAFATNNSVKIKNLTKQQILDIYTGKITNWQEVGGDDAHIVVLDRPEHASAKIVLNKVFFPEGFKVTPQAIVLEKHKEMSESLKFVANSIGFSSFGEMAVMQPEINILSLDNMFPTPANVQKRLYPYFRTFSLAVDASPKKKIMRFFEFIFGEESRKIIGKNGFSPVSMELTIATIPEQGILKQENRYRPLVDYIEKKLAWRVKIRLKHLASYEDVLSEFINGTVNAAFFGSLTYGIVKAKKGATAIARPEKDDVSQYCGLILARRGSGIKKFSDLKGKSFSMIKATTAADVFPRLMLKQKGFDQPEDFFGDVQYVGSHDVSIEMIMHGKVAAGAAKDLIFEKMARENPKIKEELVVLAKSEPVPENALVIHHDLDIACYNCHFKLLGQLEQKEAFCEHIQKQLLSVLLEMGKDEEGQEVLAGIGADRFLQTSDSDYENLYQMTQELGINLAQYPLN